MGKSDGSNIDSDDDELEADSDWSDLRDLNDDNDELDDEREAWAGANRGEISSGEESEDVMLKRFFRVANQLEGRYLKRINLANPSVYIARQK